MTETTERGHPTGHVAAGGERRQAATGRQPWASLARLLMPRRMPVAIKLALVISAVVSVGVGALGAILIHGQVQLLERQIRSFGRVMVHQMAESAKEPLLANDTLLLEVLAANLASGEDVVGTAIFSADAALVAEAGANPFQNGGPLALTGRRLLDGALHHRAWTWDSPHWGPLDAETFVSPVRFQGVTAGYVAISIDRGVMNRTIGEAVRYVAIATLVLVFIGLGVSWVLGRRLSRPIDSLVDASRAIGSGRLDFRFDERRHDEIGHLMQAFNTMADGLLEKSQVEQAFSRYLAPGVAREILGNLEQVNIGGKPVEASVLFIDIVGFTAKSELLSPEGVARLLNHFYANVTHAASLYRGSVDKYIGDAAMVVFGAPEEDLNHTFHAIACAVYLQQLTRRINARRIDAGGSPVFYRIGINSGDMIAGNIGSREHMQYTVVGDAVNLASRLCSAAGSDQIIITEATYHLPGIRDKIIAVPHQEMRVRGKSKPVRTYLVQDVMEPYRAIMLEEIAAFLARDSAGA